MRSLIGTRFIVAAVVVSILFDAQFAAAFEILTKGSMINEPTITIDGKRVRRVKQDSILLKQSNYESQWYKFNLGIKNIPDIYVKVKDVENNLFPPKDISLISLVSSGQYMMQEIEQGTLQLPFAIGKYEPFPTYEATISAPNVAPPSQPITPPSQPIAPSVINLPLPPASGGKGADTTNKTMENVSKKFDVYLERARTANWNANLEVSYAKYLSLNDVAGHQKALEAVTVIKNNLMKDERAAQQAFDEDKDSSSAAEKDAMEKKKKEYDSFVHGVDASIDSSESAVRRAQRAVTEENSNKQLLAPPGRNMIRLASYGDANRKNPVSDGEFIVLSNKNNSDAGYVSGWQRTHKDGVNLYIAPNSQVSLSCSNGATLSVPDATTNLFFKLTCLNPNKPIEFTNDSEGSKQATLLWGVASSSSGKYYYNATLIEDKSCVEINKAKAKIPEKPNIGGALPWIDSIFISSPTSGGGNAPNLENIVQPEKPSVETPIPPDIKKDRGNGENGKEKDPKKSGENEKNVLLGKLPKRLKIMTSNGAKLTMGEPFLILSTSRGNTQPITLAGKTYNYRALQGNKNIYFESNSQVPNDKYDILYTLTSKGTENIRLQSREVEGMFATFTYNIYEATDPKISDNTTNKNQNVGVDSGPNIAPPSQPITPPVINIPLPPESGGKGADTTPKMEKKKTAATTALAAAKAANEAADAANKAAEAAKKSEEETKSLRNKDSADAAKKSGNNAVQTADKAMIAMWAVANAEMEATRWGEKEAAQEAKNAAIAAKNAAGIALISGANAIDAADMIFKELATKQKEAEERKKADEEALAAENKKIIDAANAFISALNSVTKAADDAAKTANDAVIKVDKDEITSNDARKIADEIKKVQTHGHNVIFNAEVMAILDNNKPVYLTAEGGAEAFKSRVQAWELRDIALSSNNEAEKAVVALTTAADNADKRSAAKKKEEDVKGKKKMAATIALAAAKAANEAADAAYASNLEAHEAAEKATNVRYSNFTDTLSEIANKAKEVATQTLMIGRKAEEAAVVAQKAADEAINVGEEQAAAVAKEAAKNAKNAAAGATRYAGNAQKAAEEIFVKLATKQKETKEAEEKKKADEKALAATQAKDAVARKIRYEELARKERERAEAERLAIDTLKEAKKAAEEILKELNQNIGLSLENSLAKIEANQLAGTASALTLSSGASVEESKRILDQAKGVIEKAKQIKKGENAQVPLTGKSGSTLTEESIPERLKIRSIENLKYEVVLPATSFHLKSSKRIKEKTYYEIKSLDDKTLFIEENDSLPSKKYEVTYELTNPRMDEVITVTQDPVYGNTIRSETRYYVYDATFVKKTLK